MCMENLPFLLLSILTITCPPVFARPLKKTDNFITFFTNNMFENSIPFSTPMTNNNGKTPFFHTNGDKARGKPKGRARSFSSRGEIPSGWLSVITNVQTLEIGNMTVIEEELISMSPLKGKVQGIYVASLGDANISMLVIKAVFDGGRFENSLRFFGEFKPGLSESHIAVVGGSGRYHGTNGFAIVKAIDEGVFEGMRKKNKLLFKVYIK